MKSNIEKCKVLHAGTVSTRGDTKYFIENNSGEACELAVSHEEKDLGVKITEDLKHHAQFKLAASKANRALGSLKKNYKCRSLELK